MMRSTFKLSEIQNLHTLMGLKIHSDPYINDFELQKRTWRERLFTRPWSPFKRTKRVYSPKVYIVGNVLLCSPRSYVDLRAQLEAQMLRL